MSDSNINIKDYINQRPHWKKIWQVVSGNIKDITVTEIEKCFVTNQKLIFDGLLQYTVQLETDADESQTNILLSGPSPERPPYPEKMLKTMDEKSETETPLCKKQTFQRFMKRLAKYLKVSKEVAWKILTSYIMYEYCGSLKNFEKLKYEMHILPMLSNIWKFYTSERMFVIKILKTCLEFMDVKDHPYSAIYRRFIYDLGIRNIWNSLLQQFKYLLTEITSHSYDNDTPMKLWLERNFREQIEILHCLIILIDYASVTLKDLKEVLTLFKSHGFGFQPSCYEALLIVEQVSFDKLKYAEIAVILCMANSFWSETKSWYEDSDEEVLDEDMASLIHHDEFAPIVYIWIIMHMVLPNAVDLYNNKYSKWTEKALNLKIFNFFYLMMKHDMFEHTSLVGVNVRESMYHLLFITCSKFNQGATLLDHPGSLALVAELLKTPQLSEEFFNQGANGLMIMWSHTMNFFPYKFPTIAVLGEALVLSNPEHVEPVMREVELIHYYTIKADQKHPEKNVPPDHVGRFTVVRRLSFSKTHFSSVTEISPDMVYATYNDVPVLRFNRDNNLWFELFEVLNSALVVGSDLNLMIDNLTSGLNFTVAVLKQDQHALDKYAYLNDIVKACINMFVKCSGEREPPLKLLSLCLDIFTELLPNYRSDLLSTLDSNKLLPSLLKNPFEFLTIFRMDAVNPGIIGNIIIIHEKNPQQYFLVLSYLNFLRTSLQSHKGDFSIIELPGLIFVLKNIFLSFPCWYSNEDAVFKEVLYRCINIIYEMFQFTAEQVESDAVRRTMHDVTLRCLLDENWARILLKMLVSGSNNIQVMMENQTNWYFGPGVKYISTIQMILSLLLQVLELRKKQMDRDTHFPLENFIYSENHNLRVIKAVANLLNHPFNNSIPNLACRLLKKFTLELDTSMLACLELEPDQVRLMFLQRLRDNSESDELKSAIVELITASISCQPGMTEAFFTSIGSESEQVCTNDPPSECQLSLNENVGNFMVEYLTQATLETVCQHSSLLYKIMELFHVLWMNQKEMLIKDLINDEQFWSSLCNPLFHDAYFANKMYAQIINILTKEIHKMNGKISSSLLDVLNRLFSCDEKYINFWTDYVFNEENVASETNETSSQPSLLSAWKNFIVVAVKLMPDNFFSMSYKIKLTNMCRESLKKHLILMEDTKTIIFCAELYLFLMTSWNDIVCMNSEILFADIINLLHKVALSYRILPQRLQEVILTVTAVSFKSLKTIIPNQFIPANTLVESVIQIFNHEYDSLQECCKNKSLSSFDRKTHRSYFLCLSILNELLTAPNSEIKTNYMHCLNQSEIFRIILSCAGILTKHACTMPLAKDALETLIFYVFVDDSTNFITTEIALLLWEKFLPTKEYFKPAVLGTVQPVPLNLKEWWKIYKRLIILLIILLKKHRHLVLKEVIMFVSLHEDYIKEILLLVINSVDFYALDLVLITLNLMHELTKYRCFWAPDKSYYNIIETIKMTLQCSAALIVRPNILKYFTVDEFGQKAILSESVPTDNLVKLIDIITNIVTISTNCILLVSPPLLPTVRDNQDYSYWELQLDTNFGLPKLGHSELTFGTLLCLSCLYVRILQQINNEKKARQEKVTEKGSNTSLVKESRVVVEVHDPFSNVTKLKYMVAKPLTSKTCIGFIRLDYLNPLCNLSSVQNFSYSTSVTIFPWYSKLNEVFVSRALETILTLLASQIGSLLKYREMEKHDKRYIRRELCSELQVFYEFVRKKLFDLYSCTGKDRGSFLRKRIIKKPAPERIIKKRSRCWVKSNASQTNPETKETAANTSSSRKHDLRELSIVEERNEDSEDESNAGTETSYDSHHYRKPEFEKFELFIDIDAYKRNTCGNYEDDQVVLIPEDYIHLLSNWFMYVLKTDNK